MKPPSRGFVVQRLTFPNAWSMGGGGGQGLLLAKGCALTWCYGVFQEGAISVICFGGSWTFSSTLLAGVLALAPEGCSLPLESHR